MDSPKKEKMQSMFDNLSAQAQAKVIGDMAEIEAKEKKQIERFTHAMEAAGADPAMVEKTVECYKTAS